MNEEQEIRAKALEITAIYKSNLAAACIQSGQSCSVYLYDDVETAVDYITSGKMSEKSP